MKHYLYLLAVVALSLCPKYVYGQYENKLVVKPTGRVLLDGALNFPDDPLYEEYSADGSVELAGPRLADGAALPDVRLGAKASYGHWQAKVDVGYAFHKLSFKDVFIQYDFNPTNYIRGGYFVAPFGLNSAVSSSMIPTMESPVSDDFFQVSNRNVGLMFLHYKDSYYAAVTGLLESGAITSHANDNGKLSSAAAVRLVYRPYHEEGRVLQAGISAWCQSPFHYVEENGTLSKGYFDFTSGFPTRVNRVDLLDAMVRDASGVYKVSPELLLAYGRLALEAQYYYMNVPRRHGKESFSAQGGYASLRALLIGKGYGYASEDAGLATPAPGSLEMVLGYNYTDGSCRKADVHGGRVNDFSMTFTYYFNKYMLARLRYSYTKVSDSEVLRLHRCHANILQARIQFIF